jgi:hypothetical protein
VDSTGDTGSDPSLALDAAGRPVISYHDFGVMALKLVHCNDPDCAGGDESPVTVDGSGTVRGDTSLALDAAGNPVVSFEGTAELRLVHCDDVNCAGDDERVVVLDSGGRVGADPSLALDASGNPVVSYRDITLGDLKLVHCNDPDCTDGGRWPSTPAATR